MSLGSDADFSSVSGDGPPGTTPLCVAKEEALEFLYPHLDYDDVGLEYTAKIVECKICGRLSDTINPFFRRRCRSKEVIKLSCKKFRPWARKNKAGHPEGLECYVCWIVIAKSEKGKQRSEVISDIVAGHISDFAVRLQRFISTELFEALTPIDDGPLLTVTTNTDVGLTTEQDWDFYPEDVWKEAFPDKELDEGNLKAHEIGGEQVKGIFEKALTFFPPQGAHRVIERSSTRLTKSIEADRSDNQLRAGQASDTFDNYRSRFVVGGKKDDDDGGEGLGTPRKSSGRGSANSPGKPGPKAKGRVAKRKALVEPCEAQEE